MTSPRFIQVKTTISYSIETMTMAKWTIVGHQILLDVSSEERVLVPAIDIFRAAFSRLRVCANEVVNSPIEDIPSLTFSRQPAQPAVRLWGSAGGNLMLTFGIATDTGFAQATADDDQIIHDGRWYPIKTDLMQSALEWLGALGIKPEGHITVGNLVALRAKHEMPLVVFDEVLFKASSKSVQLSVSGQ